MGMMGAWLMRDGPPYSLVICLVMFAAIATLPVYAALQAKRARRYEEAEGEEAAASPPPRPTQPAKPPSSKP